MVLITIVTGVYKPTNITGGGGTLYIRLTLWFPYPEQERGFL